MHKGTAESHERLSRCECFSVLSSLIQQAVDELEAGESDAHLFIKTGIV